MRGGSDGIRWNFAAEAQRDTNTAVKHSAAAPPSGNHNLLTGHNDKLASTSS